MPIDLYPNIAKVKRNGVYQNLPGFVQQSGDSDIEAMIANSETSTTAQYAHPEGSYFILNDVLYKAIIDISVNDTIAVGTNCKIAILSDDMSEIANDLKYAFINLSEIAITESAGYFNNNGGISSQGATTLEVYTNKISTQPLVKILFKQTLTVSKTMWVAVGLYDKYGQWIRREVLLPTTDGDSFTTEYTVPDNVYYVAFTYRTYGISTVSVNIEILTNYYTKEEISEQNSNINDKITDVETDSDGNVPMPPVEIGRVYYSNGALVYDNQTFAVRTKRGEGIKLKAGDIIRNSNPDAYAILGAYTTDNGITFIQVPTSLTPYVVPTDGIFFLTFRRNDEATITNISDHIKNFEIFRPSSRDSYGNIRSGFDVYGMKSINHRGYNDSFPENTIPAFIKSAEVGFPIVETDLRFTSDNVPVLLHDATINRTARNADGSTISEDINIADITYAQALEYDFGIYKGADFAGTKIPTLAEAVVVWKNLGIKAYIDMPVTNVTNNISAYNIVKSANYEKCVTWISSNYQRLYCLIFIDKNVRIGYVVDTITSEKISQLKTLKTKFNEVFIDGNKNYLSSETLALVKNANELVELWTINTEQAIIDLDSYISGVTSDSLIAQKVLRDSEISTLPT